MAWVSTIPVSPLFKKVKLTREAENLYGKFTVGSIVTVTEINDRGYTVEDENGNKVSEIGFDGIEVIENQIK